MSLLAASSRGQIGGRSPSNRAFRLWVPCIDLATTIWRSLRKIKPGAFALWNKPCLRNAGHELTIEEVVADPIVCDLMRADHVDPGVFETLLRSAAARSMATENKLSNVVAARALTWIKAAGEANEP